MTWKFEKWERLTGEYNQSYVCTYRASIRIWNPMANWAVESYRPGGAKRKNEGGCGLGLQRGGRHSHGDGKANVK